jgi:beta-lactamase regulating signal transducer with metallopeptidase domain
MMSGFLSSTGWLPFLAALAAKATLVLLLTAIAAAALWRASAATRHLVWCAGIVGVLTLPVFSALLPSWELPLLPAREPAAPARYDQIDRPVRSVQAPASAPAPTVLAAPAEADAAWLPRAAAGVALTGVAAGLLWLALGFWGVARLGRRAEVVRDPEWLRTSHEAAEQLGLRRPVLLLRTRGSVMPATGGLLWPVIVVPDVAEEWPADRRRAVLAHELAHVKRFDCLTQALAQVACALFWWHPAVWYAARRLRVERERACDDLVLRAGTRPSEYAAHLLEIARAHRGLRLATPALVSMARPSHLESRLLWVLDAARARGVPSGRATALSLLAALLAAGSLSALRPTPASAGESTVTRRAAPAPAGDDEEGKAEGEKKGAHFGVDVDVRLPALLGPGAAVAGDTFPEVDDLVALRAAGVDAAYIAELRQAGYGPLTVEQLVELGANGVDARFIAQANAMGFGRLSVEDLAEFAAMEVTPAYVQELRSLGLTNLTAEDVVDMAAVGVNRELVEGLARAGLRGLSAEELQELAAMDVTAEYVAELARAGYANLSAEAISEMAAAEVDAAYIAEMRAAGISGLDAEALTEMAAVGVDAAYVRELAAVGLRGLSAEQLTELSAAEVTAEWIRELRAAGFAELTAEQLVRLKTSGVDRELIDSRRNQ